MSLTLEDVELRVLGVLIEKAMTTPNGYPLTINSLVLGANQLQNRDPVMSIKDSDVSKVLQSLGHKRLVTQAPPSAGARANKYQHTVVDTLHWDSREQAIMAELMLRGPQTPGELRTRSSRMCAIADVAGALNVLGELAQHDPPFVEELSRQPGRASNRFRHLLDGDAAHADSGASASDVSDGAGVGVFSAGATDTASSSAAGGAGAGLLERLDVLEERLIGLERRLADVEKNTNRPDAHRSDPV